MTDAQVEIIRRELRQIAWTISIVSIALIFIEITLLTR